MTEQEKLELLKRAIKSARNWGIGFGLMVVAALPVSALATGDTPQEYPTEEYKRIIHDICNGYANIAGGLLVMRRDGMSWVGALRQFGFMTDDETANANIRVIIHDVWNLPNVNIPQADLEDAVYVSCIESML